MERDGYVMRKSESAPNERMNDDGRLSDDWQTINIL